MNSTAPRSFVVVQNNFLKMCLWGMWLLASAHQSTTAAHSWTHAELQRRKWPQLIPFSSFSIQCFCIKGCTTTNHTLSLAPPLGRQDATHFTQVISFPPQREHVRSRWSALSRWESRDWKRIHGCNNVAEPDGKPRAVWLHSSCPSY